MLSVLGVGSAIVLAAATPQAAPPPAAAAAPKSNQAAFDAASKAAEDGRCAEAVATFDQLATSSIAAKNAVVAGTIDIRRGLCLERLGQYALAEERLRAGTARLAKQGPDFAIELRGAYLGEARLAGRRLDYDTAIADANRALALSNGAARATPLMLLAGFTRFDGDGVAIKESTEALELIQASPGATKPQIANMQTYAARALMAAGRNEEAYALLKRALANNGGLTTRSNLGDIATRYDLAQAALLLKRTADARTYLAYTGAGRISEAPFATATRLEAPACDSVPGMSPDAYAVVEFSLAADGTVARAEPVYARGNRQVALAFAEAVRNWAWTPERAQAIPPFYREMTRVELRCTRSQQQGDTLAPLTAAAAAWLESKGAKAPDKTVTEPQVVDRMQQVATGGGIDAVVANMALANSLVVPEDTRTIAHQRLISLSRSLGAPRAVRTYYEIDAIDAASGSGRREGQRRVDAYRALLAQPDVTRDPESAATLRLLMARASSSGGKTIAADADTLLAGVTDAPDLPPHHPLRVSALLARANRAAAAGDLAAADGFFQRTGLDEQQCALIGPKPAMTKNAASSADYPREAWAMGFEGWARVEYDIGPDGRTAQQRTLVAYPPFVFGDAAKGIIANSRFERSYRPTASVACAANQQNFVFAVQKR